MWNSQAHLEAYLAVPSMGAVLHTLNLRLAPAEVAYIISHARGQGHPRRRRPRARARARAAAVDAPAGALHRRRRRRRPRRSAPTCSTTARSSPTRRPASTGPSSTRTPPRPCATRAAPPASPRASSTATARPGCTRWRSAWARRSASASATRILPDRPHVPRQRLGPALRRLDVGRRSAAMPVALRQRRRHLPPHHRRRARPSCAGVPTVFRDMLAHAESNAGRSLVGARRRCAAARRCPRRSSTRFEDALRRADLPGLGHDRDLAAGRAVGRRPSAATAARRCSIAP